MRISAGGILPEIRARVIRAGMMIRIRTIDINRGMPAKSLYFNNLYYFFRDITE
jgi:hypothetical protein